MYKQNSSFRAANSLPPGKFFKFLFYCLLIFSESIFFEILFQGLNKLDPDQALHFVGPDLDLICLQRL